MLIAADLTIQPNQKRVMPVMRPPLGQIWELKLLVVERKSTELAAVVVNLFVEGPKVTRRRALHGASEESLQRFPLYAAIGTGEGFDVEVSTAHCRHPVDVSVLISYSYGRA